MSGNSALTDVPTLDLHGCTKEAALQQVTIFLEQHHQSSTPQVCIITGQGSHSQQGPVLRTAVTKYLEKRKFQFSRPTPGSFLVKPKSGELWFRQDSCEEDTKVLLRNNEDEDIRILQASKRPGRGYNNRGINKPSSGLISDTGNLPEVGPSLSEVARAENDLARAKKESLESSRAAIKEQSKEERDFTKALTLSQEEVGRSEKDEAERLAHAMALSQEHEASIREEEEQLLQQVLQESQKEVCAKEEEEKLLQQVLQDSQKEGAEELSESELEQALHKALEQLLATATTPAIDEDEEERMIQEALALSLKE